MARILLTDGEQRSTLAATRSLGRAGHEVLVAAASPKPLAGASRYCRRAFTVPGPGAGGGKFPAALEGIVESEGVEMVIPMTDVSAPAVLALRDRLPELRVPFPDADTYRAVSDKRHLLGVASDLGIPVPRQVELETPPGDDPEPAQWRDLRFPLVAKPARSAVEGAAGMEKFGVAVAADDDALERILGRYPASAYPILLQEQITGSGLGAFALFHEGEPVAWFAHRRIREKPPTGGVSVYRESIRLRDDLREHATRLLSHFRWSGVAMVEFKEDTATGIPYLMEVNGRFWGSLQLAVDAGVDFPALLVDRAMGGAVSPTEDYREGIRSRWLWGDVDHLLAMLRRGRTYRRTHPELPGAMGALGRFLIPWRPGDRFEVLRPGDPAPFVRETAAWFGSLRG